MTTVEPRRYLAKTGLKHPDQAQFIEGLAVLRERLQMVLSGQETTALALTLTGAARNGKTELSKLVPKFIPELLPTAERVSPVLMVTLTSGTTVKSMWADLCAAADVQFEPRETEAALVPKLFRRLKSLGTLMIIIDEAHHTLSGGRGDIQVANRIKSRLLDNVDHPIFVILIGLNDVEDFVKLDPQLAGRTTPTRLRDFTRLEAHKFCRALITKGCERANLTVASDIDFTGTSGRFSDAANGRFGLIIDLIDRALRRAISLERNYLCSDDLIFVARKQIGTHANDIFDDKTWRPPAEALVK